MRFDEYGRVYWNSLTPQQKFEWDYMGIDPTKKRRPPNENRVCSKHLEVYAHECPKCTKYSAQKEI
jgi:hypothetical protein